MRQEEGNWEIPSYRKILPLGIALFGTQHPLKDQKGLK